MNNSQDDSELYIIANQEVDTNTQDDALWRKAMALTAGNTEKAKYKYLKLRVQQFKKTGIPYLKSKPKATQTKQEQKINTDTSYGERRINKIDEALNQNQNTAIDTEDGKIPFKGIFLMLMIILIVTWVIININKSANNSDSTYVEKPIITSTQTDNNYNYNTTSYDDKFSLHIITFPSNAKVSILNIKPKYYDNIRLKPGKYHIKVSSIGYESKLFWVNLNTDIKRKIYLNRIGNTFSLNITTNPSNATIKILNIKPKFKQGILLKKGLYHIEVSKRDFNTKREWIKLDHDSHINITLTKKAFTSAILSYDELKWCVNEQKNLDSLKRNLDILYFTVDRYSQSAIDSYNRKVKKLNNRNKLWNKRCQNKKYKQSDYNNLKRY